MSIFSTLQSENIAGELKRALLASMILAALTIPYCFALSALIFAGPLHLYVVPGAGMMLFGSTILTLLIAISSSYRGALAVPHDIPAAALGTMAVAVTSSMVDAPLDAAFMTMTTLLILCSLVTGLVFLVIGIGRMSNLLRFIPFPVTAGCFAGLGWVLCLAALSMMSSMPIGWRTIDRLFEPDTVLKWTPGIAYGVVLMLVMERKPSVAFPIWSFLLLTCVFHTVLYVSGITVESAQSAGLLWSGVGGTGLWPAFGPGDFGLVDWSVVLTQISTLIGVTVLMVLSMLIITDGLVLATGVEIDHDREFRIAGAAGILAGMGGSSPGAHSIVLSIASRKLGAGTPWAGVFASVWLGATLFLGNAVLQLIPIMFVGGLIFFIGIDLLYNWLIKVRKRLNWRDYGIIVVIAVTIAVFGIVEGVAIGLVANFGLFALYLVRSNPIETTLSGLDLQSNRIRSVIDQSILLSNGERIRIVRLRGYIFFGTIYRLIRPLKKLLAETPTPALIVLDCTNILGFDASALNTLVMFLRTAHANGAHVVFAASSDSFQSRVSNDLPDTIRERVWFERNLDLALERCEDLNIRATMRQLEGTGEDGRTDLLDRVAEDLEDHLSRQIHFEELVGQLERWVDRCEYAPGDALSGSDGLHHGMQLVVSGRISVYDALGTRLFQVGPGNVVAPMAVFGGLRTSTIEIAEERCVTVMLTPAGHRQLELEKPDLSRRLYRFMLTDRRGQRYQSR